MSPPSLLRRVLRPILRSGRRGAEHLAVRLTTGSGTVMRVHGAGRGVALTFDDGPDPEWTPRLLDLLEHHGARGTFFVVGEAAARHRDLLQRLVDAGHALGNHTWDHPSLPLLPAARRATQLQRCAEVLQGVGGDGGLLRPPYGHQTRNSLRQALELGYTVVMGDVIAEDWRDDPADVLTARIRARLEPGAIVLLHDRLATFPEGHEPYRDRRPTLDAVEMILQEFTDSDQADRFDFVTVPELLRRGQPRYGYRLLAPDFDHLQTLRQAGPQTRDETPAEG